MTRITPNQNRRKIVGRLLSKMEVNLSPHRRGLSVWGRGGAREEQAYEEGRIGHF